MPRTATKQKPAKKPKPVTEFGDVLTLAQAATYLQVTEADVLEAASKGMPGRIVGSQWRFARSALTSWLHVGVVKRGISHYFGTAADDPHLDEIVREVYRSRKQDLVG